MTDNAVTPSTPDEVPAPPPDAENPALIDALTTFKITVVTAIVFVVAAAAIILSTRLG